MNYTRVLPRDAFNEANLLKCIGQLALVIHNRPESTQFRYDHDGTAFDIQMDQNSGEIFAANFHVTYNGEKVRVFNSMNSRLRYPLIVRFSGGEEHYVFDEVGELRDIAPDPDPDPNAPEIEEIPEESYEEALNALPPLQWVRNGFAFREFDHGQFTKHFVKVKGRFFKASREYKQGSVAALAIEVREEGLV